MKKALKWIIAIMLGVVGVQADVVWNDSFEGASLNENLSVVTSAQGSVTQTGGQLQMFLSGNGNTQRAKVTTAKGQEGQTTFNGEDLYDFTAHEVSVRFDIASFVGSPAAGANYNVFHTGIGELSAAAAITKGLQVNLEKRLDAEGSDWWRFTLAGFGSSVHRPLNGQPSAFEYDVFGNSLTIRVEGTTFATGEDTLSWTFGEDTAASYHLMFGAFNAGNPVTGTEVALDSFRVAVPPEPQPGVVWDDAFDGASLNENLSVVTSAQGSVTQTGGQLQMFLSGNGNTQRAKVTTAKGQEGQTQHYNGSTLYDFIDHQVSVRFDIASFGGSPAAGANYNVFHTGIGELSAAAAITKGLQVNLEKRLDAEGSDWWRFELAGFGSITHRPLNGQPSAFEYDVFGNSLTIRVEGTTFADTGSDTFSWTFNEDTAASYDLMFGAFNAGTPVTGTEVALNSFRVAVPPEPPLVDDSLWWDDTFTGTLNEHYTVWGTSLGTVSLSNDQMVLDVGDAGDNHQVNVHVNTDSSGNPVSYNWYAGGITASFDIASIAGKPGSNRNWFYFSVGEGDGGVRYAPREGHPPGTPGNRLQNGIGFSVENHSTGWRVVYGVFVGGVETQGGIVGLISGVPTKISYILDKRNVVIQMEGADFTSYGQASQGVNNQEALLTVQNISEHITDYHLAFGAYNRGSVEERTVVRLNSFSAGILPPPGPESATVFWVF